MLAEWKYDGGQGDLLRDSSGNENHGTIHGATWAKNRTEYALSLDGTKGYVDCGDKPSLRITGPMSVEAWIKPISREWGGGILFGKGWREYSLSYSSWMARF